MMMQSRLDIAADHPSFEGHFPGFPVLPGALLLDEMLSAIERGRGIDLRAWQISSAKFLDVVRPSDKLVLEHETCAEGRIRFTVRDGSRNVASGTLWRTDQDETL
jgi:3-hydroxymyristoyl/3-hydroxydecanoyl-(acyl carrier protein) dehydratase